jgi:peptidoglycan LD-endopeptidase CwlK
VHPDPVRLVERAIQITTQDFRGQEGLRTRERQAALVARGASRTMNSRHLTGHAVDLVAGWRRNQLVVGGLFPGRSPQAGRGA